MAVRRWPPSVMPITSRRVTPVRCRFQTTVRVVPVPAPFPDHGEGAPGPSHLGTGETADLNWQEEARGLAGWPRSRCRFQTTVRVPPVPRTWGPGRPRTSIGRKKPAA